MLHGLPKTWPWTPIWFLTWVMVLETWFSVGWPGEVDQPATSTPLCSTTSHRGAASKFSCHQEPRKFRQPLNTMSSHNPSYFALKQLLWAAKRAVHIVWPLHSAMQGSLDTSVKSAAFFLAYLLWYQPRSQSANISSLAFSTSALFPSPLSPGGRKRPDYYFFVACWNFPSLIPFLLRGLSPSLPPFLGAIMTEWLPARQLNLLRRREEKNTFSADIF